MNGTNRFLLIVLVLGLFLLLIFIFGSFLLETFLEPLALAAWFLLRVFVLSIDQIMIWGLVIGFFFIFIMLRLARVRIPLTQNENKIRDPNIILKRLEHWRYSFLTIPEFPANMKMFKRELAYMLVSIYASRKRIQADYLAYDAFKNHEIPLPENIYAFLFTGEPGKVWPGLRLLLDRLLGRDTVKFYCELNAYLDYLEKLLEMKHGQ